jgi:hypothetical protein
VGLIVNIVEELKDAAPLVKHVGEELNLPAVKRIMGRAIAAVTKHHFEELAADSQHHQTADSLGGTRTGFYSRAAKSVQQPQIQSDGLSISMMGAIARRLFGGRIDALPGHLLPVAARAESYGFRPREFSFLKLILFPSGLRALVDKNEKAHEGSVWYWLMKYVIQHEDPTVLPTESEMLEPALANASAYLEKLWARAAGGAATP